jgi:hypothetical protein
MSSQGPFPTTDVSSIAWNNPANAGADDGVYADKTVFSAGQTTNQLACRGFGFSIPTGAIVQGIKTTIKRKADANPGFEDLNVFLLVAGSAAGSNKAIAGNWSTSDVYVDYGGTTDTWGRAWTPAEINDSLFGIVLTALCNVGGSTAFVDYVEITVYYTLAAEVTSTIAATTTFGNATITHAFNANLNTSTTVGNVQADVDRKITSTLASVVTVGAADLHTMEVLLTSTFATATVFGSANLSNDRKLSTTLSSVVTFGAALAATDRHATTTLAATTAFGSAEPHNEGWATTLSAGVTFQSALAGTERHVTTTIATVLTFTPPATLGLKKPVVATITTVTVLGTVTAQYFNRPFMTIGMVATFGAADLHNVLRITTTIQGETSIGVAGQVHRELSTTLPAVVSFSGGAITQRHFIATISTATSFVGNAKIPKPETTTLQTLSVFGLSTLSVTRKLSSTLATTTTFGPALPKRYLTSVVTTTTAIGTALAATFRRASGIVSTALAFTAQANTRLEKTLTLATTVSFVAVEKVTRELSTTAATTTLFSPAGNPRRKITSTFASVVTVGAALATTRLEKSSTFSTAVVIGGIADAGTVDRHITTTVQTTTAIGVVSGDVTRHITASLDTSILVGSTAVEVQRNVTATISTVVWNPDAVAIFNRHLTANLSTSVLFVGSLNTTRSLTTFIHTVTVFDFQRKEPTRGDFNHTWTMPPRESNWYLPESA